MCKLGPCVNLGPAECRTACPIDTGVCFLHVDEGTGSPRVFTQTSPQEPNRISMYVTALPLSPVVEKFQSV